MRPTATSRIWAGRRALSMQRGDPKRLAEAAAAVQRIAVLAVPCGVLGSSEQQPAAVGIAVLAVILEQAERDLLVVGIVSQPGAGQRQRAYQRRRVVAALEIRLRPADRLGGIQRDGRGFD